MKLSFKSKEHKRNFFLKGNKGISIMVGYVLLITFAVIMGGIIFRWLGGWIPRGALECPDGISIMIKDSQCTLDGNDIQLNITLKNNGRFDIGGYFIHATNDSNQELATIDLSSNITDEGDGGVWINPGVKFGLGTENSLSSGHERKNVFLFEEIYFNNIYSIEIIPVRWQTKDGKKRFVSCGNARVSEEIVCS